MPPIFSMAPRTPEGGSRCSSSRTPEPLFNLDGARRTLLGNREIFLAHAHGHSVVVWRNLDVVYSLVSDLDEDETLFSSRRCDSTEPLLLLRWGPARTSPQDESLWLDGPLVLGMLTRKTA